MLNRVILRSIKNNLLKEWTQGSIWAQIYLGFNLGIYAIFVFVNTKNTHMLIAVQRNAEWIPWTCYQCLKVQLKPEHCFRVVRLWWWLKVQPRDDSSRVLTAYKSAPCEKKFRIDLQQYWKACSCAILLPCGSVVHYCLLS